jgi:hypothetical protein
MKSAVLVNGVHAGSYRSAIMRGDSLALGVIGQTLEECGWRIETFDAFLRRWDLDTLTASIPDDFDALFVTLMHETGWPSAKCLAETLRERQPRMVALIGGAAVTLNPARYLEPSSFDYAYAGTSLVALRRLLSRMTRSSTGNAVLMQAGTAQPTDLEPLVRRPDLERSFAVDRIVALETSQGCYARCAFCSIYTHHRQAWFTKSPTTVLAEVDAIRRRLPDCSELRFVDANFFGVPLTDSDLRAQAIAEGLRSRGMRFRLECRSNDVRRELFETLVADGLTGLFMGLESGVDRILRGIDKGASSRTNLKAIDILRDLGCSLSFGFMMITKDTTHEDIQANLEFLRRVGNGLRFKHLFSGLIHQEGTKLSRRSLSVLDSNRKLEARLGYVPDTEIARKLMLVWNAFTSEHGAFLSLEHTLGISLERGREARLAAMWELDRKFGAACLDRYEALLEELMSTPMTAVDAVAARCVADLVPAFTALLEEVRAVGLPAHVMLDDLRATAPIPNGAEKQPARDYKAR